VFMNTELLQLFRVFLLDWLSLLRSVGALLIHATLMDEADIFLLRCPSCLELTRVLSTCSGSVLAANDCFASHEKRCCGGFSKERT
jgi:hypothetical protein